MRESRQSGSEGGGAGSNRLSLPLSIGGRYATKCARWLPMEQKRNNLFNVDGIAFAQASPTLHPCRGFQPPPQRLRQLLVSVRHAAVKFQGGLRFATIGRFVARELINHSQGGTIVAAAGIQLNGSTGNRDCLRDRLRLQMPAPGVNLRKGPSVAIGR